MKVIFDCLIALAILCCCSSFKMDKRSPSFFSEELNFQCPSVECDSVSNLRNGYFHVVVGLDHQSSFPLLVYRVCEGLQRCIHPTNFKIVVHSLNKVQVNKPTHKMTMQFLNDVGIDVHSWVGNFTANFKMVKSLETLKGIDDEDRWIYHSDLDEVPEDAPFSQALEELRSGSCDVIRGKWVDRVSGDGKIKNVILNSKLSLNEQFPVKCNISAKFVPDRTLYKIMVYRSKFRLVSGQHDVWCNKALMEIKAPPQSMWAVAPGRNVNSWSWDAVCRGHIDARIEKVSKGSDILKLIPRSTGRARTCQTLVPVNHYKFVDGVLASLEKRARHYKSLGLAWYKQSAAIVDNIRENDNKICLTCPENQCLGQ